MGHEHALTLHFPSGSEHDAADRAVADRGGVDCPRAAPAQPRYRPRPGHAGIPQDHPSRAAKSDGGDRPGGPADRHHSASQPPQRRQRTDRHDGGRRQGLGARATAAAAGGAGEPRCRRLQLPRHAVEQPGAARRRDRRPHGLDHAGHPTGPFYEPGKGVELSHSRPRPLRRTASDSSSTTSARAIRRRRFSPSAPAS